MPCEVLPLSPIALSPIAHCQSFLASLSHHVHASLSDNPPTLGFEVAVSARIFTSLVSEVSRQSPIVPGTWVTRNHTSSAEMAGFGRIWPDNAIARASPRRRSFRCRLFPRLVAVHAQPSLRCPPFQDKTRVTGFLGCVARAQPRCRVEMSGNVRICPVFSKNRRVGIIRHTYTWNFF